MPNNKKQNGNNNQGRQFRQRQNPVESAVASTAGMFAHALLKGKDDILADMTLYSQKSGGIGSNDSNVSSLRKSGAIGIHHIEVDKTLAAYVYFQGLNGGDDIPCIGRFRTAPGKHVMSDWDLYVKQ